MKLFPKMVKDKFFILYLYFCKETEEKNNKVKKRMIATFLIRYKKQLIMEVNS